MKNHLLFLCFLTLSGLSLPMQAEDVPSLVVHHYHGDDYYPVSLTDYNRINIGENNYTLVSPSGKPDITLSYKTYPRFSVENKSSDEIVTSQSEVAGDIAEAAVTYCRATQTLKSDNGAEYVVIVFNAAGQQILSGTVGEGREQSVKFLPGGIYIAIATGNHTTQSIKFAKH